MWQCFGLMGFNTLVITPISIFKLSQFIFFGWKSSAIYLLPIYDVAIFWGVQYISFCNGFYTLNFPIYIFGLEIFSNISIAHMWCGNVLGLRGSVHWFLQWFLHLKSPNLLFWLEIFSNIFIAHMWYGNLLGLRGSVYWFCSGLYILSLPIYIFWLEIFNNIFITHMYNNNNINPKKIFQTPVILRGIHFRP